MKKMILLALACLSMLGSVALGSDEIEVGQGKKTILIQIENGKGPSKQDPAARIRRLERAVRDLQQQVWNLSANQMAQELWVCTLTPFTESYESEKFALEYDARKDVAKKCTDTRGSDFFCKPASAKCEIIN